jgi:hypothetical protein
LAAVEATKYFLQFFFFFFFFSLPLFSFSSLSFSLSILRLTRGSFSYKICLPGGIQVENIGYPADKLMGTAGYVSW